MSEPDGQGCSSQSNWDMHAAPIPSYLQGHFVLEFELTAAASRSCVGGILYFSYRINARPSLRLTKRNGSKSNAVSKLP